MSNDDIIKQFAERLHDRVTDVGVHSAIDCVATEMTGDSKLIKEAYWYINPDGYYPQCSNCWEEPKSGELTPYCPNCGSKMARETR